MFNILYFLCCLFYKIIYYFTFVLSYFQINFFVYIYHVYLENIHVKLIRVCNIKHVKQNIPKDSRLFSLLYDNF